MNPMLICQWIIGLVCAASIVGTFVAGIYHGLSDDTDLGFWLLIGFFVCVLVYAVLYGAGTFSLIK